MPLVFSCGYRAVYSGRPPEEQLSVVAASQMTPETEAVQAVMIGARNELSRQGALKPGSGYPRLVVQVLRVDEAPLGIAAHAPAGEPARPLARGMTLSVTARAWVLERAGAEATADTGDIRRLARSSSESRPEIDLQARQMAIRAAAQEVGEAIAQRVLGEAVPPVEPL